MPSLFLDGLPDTGDPIGENAVKRGEGVAAASPGARFSVCSGLGAIADDSAVGAFFKLVTESIDDRLELLTCPRFIVEATLDLRLVRSDTSGVFGPAKMAKAEFPELPLLRAGRT